MSSSLYRVYRPQTFSDVVDQNAIKLTLQHEIELKRPGHAYVFSGPRGVGKTTLARIFAKSLNCAARPEGTSEPCNACLSCADIAEGRHPDVVEIDAASHTGVDHVRSAIIEYARFAPQRGGYKVFIIDEAHMLSTSAFNALLKTLEEPPERVVFILATTELHKLPETILSRCERFDFKTIHPNKIVERLGKIASSEGVVVDQEVLRQIGVRSGGYLRDAESMFGQLLGLGKKVITSEDASLALPKGNFDAVRSLIEALFRRDAKSCVERVMSLHEEGVDMRSLLIDLTSALREVVLYQVGSIRTPLFDDYFGREDIGRFFELFGSRDQRFTLTALNHCVSVFEYFRHPIPEYVIVELGLLKAIVGDHDGSFIGASRVDDRAASAQPTERASVSSSVSLSMEEITSRWASVVESCSAANPSLKFILDAAVPLGVGHGVLDLGVGFELHAQRLSDVKTRSVVETALLKTYGHALRLKVTRVALARAEGVADTHHDSLIDDLVKNFGAIG